MREERRGRVLGSGAMGLSQMQDETIWTNSGARSLTVNTRLHFHREKDQEKRFKHPFCTFLPPSTELRQPSCPRVGG